MNSKFIGPQLVAHNQSTPRMETDRKVRYMEKDGTDGVLRGDTITIDGVVHVFPPHKQMQMGHDGVFLDGELRVPPPKSEQVGGRSSVKKTGA